MTQHKNNKIDKISFPTFHIKFSIIFSVASQNLGILGEIPYGVYYYKRVILQMLI